MSGNTSIEAQAVAATATEDIKSTVAGKVKAVMLKATRRVQKDQAILVVKDSSTMKEVLILAPKRGEATLKVKKGDLVVKDGVVATLLPDVVIKSTVDGLVKSMLLADDDFSVEVHKEVLVVHKSTTKDGDDSVFESIKTTTCGVVTMSVRMGDKVKKGDEVATVAPNTHLTSPVDGTVDSVMHVNGADLLAGQGILVVKTKENKDGTTETKMSYRYREEASQVESGQETKQTIDTPANCEGKVTYRVKKDDTVKKGDKIAEITPAKSEAT